MNLKITAAILALLGATVASAGAITPAECSGTCHVESFVGGYVSPVVEIANDTEVVWGSLDVTHIHTETPATSASACFSVGSGASSDSPPVRFHIENGTLLATARDPVSGNVETKTCNNAVQLSNGGFFLPYHCTLHPNMRGGVLVNPP